MDWLAWLSGLPPAVALRQSSLLYLLVNAAHILSIGLLIGAIVPLDLRLIGIVRGGPVSVLAPFLVRVAATGLLLAVMTGLLLFSVKPQEYISNPAFLTKLGLLTVGLINILLLHRSRAWRSILSGEVVPLAAKIKAVLSLLIWIGAVIAGRWIGFL
jgi:hypothetical protein